MDNGQRTNMTVKNGYKQAVGMGGIRCIDSTGDAKSSVDDAARDSEEELSHH